MSSSSSVHDGLWFWRREEKLDPETRSRTLAVMHPIPAPRWVVLPELGGHGSHKPESAARGQGRWLRDKWGAAFGIKRSSQRHGGRGRVPGSHVLSPSSWGCWWLWVPHWAPLGTALGRESHPASSQQPHPTTGGRKGWLTGGRPLPDGRTLGRPTPQQSPTGMG